MFDEKGDNIRAYPWDKLSWCNVCFGSKRGGPKQGIIFLSGWNIIKEWTTLFLEGSKYLAKRYFKGKRGRFCHLLEDVRIREELGGISNENRALWLSRMFMNPSRIPLYLYSLFLPWKVLPWVPSDACPLTTLVAQQPLVDVTHLSEEWNKCPA